MANKTFRRVLSIIMCAAMLVSVFAVSFNVSAAGETVYDWDYASDSDALEKTLANSVVKSKSDAGSATVENGYLKINRTGAGGDATAVFFNTPDNSAPKTFTVENSQTYVDGNTNDYAAGALIAKYKYKDKEWAISFYAFTNQWGTENPMLVLGLRKFEDFWDDARPSLNGCLKYNGAAADNRAILIGADGNPVTVANANNKLTGTGNYANENVWGESGNLSNIPADKLGDFKYTYHITYVEGGVEVYVTAKYGDLSVDTVTYTISYSDLLDALNLNNTGVQRESIEAICGLSSTAVNGDRQDKDRSAKIYSVKATYAAAGEVHQHTAAAERKDVKAATCTEPGYTGDVVCAECGKVMEKGAATPALGHTPDGEGVVTDPTCTAAGYTTFHCSVCDEDYTEAGAEALGHDYQWVVTKPATDTEKGLEEHKCSRCGDVDDQKEIPVLEPEYKPEVKIASASVIVDDGINLKIDISYQDIDEESLKLTVDGKEYTLTELTDYRSVIVSKYAHQMTDKFTVTLTATGKDGKEYNDIIADYSIAKNLEDIFEKSNEETKTLIAKLANYGAAAQKYNAAANGTETGELANAFLNGEYATDAAAYEAMSDCERTGKFAAEGSLNYANAKGGLTLALQSNVAMVVKAKDVELEEGQTLWVSVQSNNKGEFKIKLEKDGDCYKAILSDIAFAPGEYKDEVKLSLVLGNDKGEFAATNSGEITYSVGAYIYKMCSEGTATAELKDLLNAMSEYYTAAVAYNAAIS